MRGEAAPRRRQKTRWVTDQVATQWVADRKTRGELTAASAKTYDYVLGLFCRWAGDTNLKDLTRLDIERWLTEMRVSASTVSYRLGILRSFFGWLAATEQIDRDPTAGVIAPQRARAVPRHLSAEVVDLVLAASDPRTAAAVSLMVQEGLRRAEVVAIQIADVHWLDRVIIVRGKGRRQRVLPLSAESASAIQAYLAAEPANSAGPLFRSRRDGYSPLQPRRVHDWVVEASERAGVHTTCHQYRHTAATDVVRSGAPLRDVQAMMGHSSITTTEQYLPWLVGDLRTAMDGRKYRRSAAERSTEGD